MKRFVSFVLMLCLLFSFAACGKGEDTKTSGSAEDEEISSSVSSASDSEQFYATDTDSPADTYLTGSTGEPLPGPETTDTPEDGSDPEENGSAQDAPDTPEGEYYAPVTPIAPVTPSNPNEPSSPSTPSAPSAPSQPETPWTPVNVVKNLVMATDQYHQRVVIYDMAKLSPGDSLDKAEVWSHGIGYAAGLKYREGTVFGDVIIIAGSKSQILSYPAGKTLWSTTNPGNNPHSIEILPSGNVVIANSTGGTLRFFFSGSNKTTYKEYPLTGAHGVLWDPERKLLWAVGDYDLVSYSLSGSGTGETLVEKSRYTLPQTGGHDLAADFSDTDYLLLTVNSCVFRFDKTDGSFSRTFPGSDAVNRGAVKGVGNNLNGNYFYCYPNSGLGRVWAGMSIAGWCTDTISYVRQTGWSTYSLERYQASSSAFYKVRVFYGKYQ